MRDTAEAQERLRALGELASGIAHDLNNTLHAMRLRLARLDGCVGSCSEHAEDLRVIGRITADAGARVKRLQDLARRREDVPDERVDLASAVASALEVVRSAHEDPERRHTLDVRLPPLPPVVGNAAEIAHVFVHVLSNARDAMPAGGRIAIEGRVAPDGGAEITVSDTGTGIPRELLGRIFDPFFTTKGRRGTGLGLSMAASVLRRLGGSISARNGAGGGAVFTLRFPGAPPVAARREERAAPAKLPARRVLVVDDDPDNLDAMRLVLEDYGQYVEVTDSGEDAAARVEAGERYDVVLCDLGLGDASGWDVARRIASAAPATRVMLVTGWADEIPRDDPRRRLVSRVLAKPLGAEDLQDVLRDPPQPPPDQPPSALSRSR
jgi:CheY-like chemotaxis protein/two-component sensor histidine kinase